MSESPNHATAPPSQETYWLTRHHVLALLLIAGTVLMLYLSFAVLKPFLVPLTWALALAVVAHPVHTWIERQVGNVNVAAALSVILVTVVMLAPAGFVVHQMAHEAAANLEMFQGPDAPTQWRATLARTSLGEAFLSLDEQFDLVSQAGQLREEFVGRSVDVVRQSVWTILNVLITMFTLFFFFRDRHEARQAVRALIPLSDGECDDVFRRVRDTIHATIYGSVLMAAIQGALGGLMFWWLGLPAPVLWGVVMGLLATVPNLGTFIIWGPTAAGLALHDEWTKATILTIWGLVAIGLIDNLLYPIMVGQRMRMHSALVFFAILGGLQVFGPAGLVLGPVVFALAQALIEIWRRRTANGHAAEAGAAPKLLLPDQAAAAPSPPIKLVS